MSSFRCVSSILELNGTKMTASVFLGTLLLGAVRNRLTPADDKESVYKCIYRDVPSAMRKSCLNAKRSWHPKSGVFPRSERYMLPFSQCTTFTVPSLDMSWIYL